MLVKIDRSFEKDIRKITDKNTLKRVASVIRQVQKADNLSEIKNLKKLSVADNELSYPYWQLQNRSDHF